MKTCSTCGRRCPDYASTCHCGVVLSGAPDNAEASVPPTCFACRRPYVPVRDLICDCGASLGAGSQSHLSVVDEDRHDQVRRASVSAGILAAVYIVAALVLPALAQSESRAMKGRVVLGSIALLYLLGYARIRLGRIAAARRLWIVAGVLGMPLGLVQIYFVNILRNVPDTPEAGNVPALPPGAA